MAEQSRMAAPSDYEQKPQIRLSIPFATEKEAEIAYNSLSVDAELKRSQCRRVITVEKSALVVVITAPDARALRTSCNAFMDHVILVTETITRFGPPLEKKQKLQTSEETTVS
ncbi:PREDICTED: EKC/KEOPS complex subunit LAGE3-like [Priapulus caudatus]|uniref:EKC/KEOPS complex subunit LAGE3-like n=1 Tax=Priapulus caudatus TaxID=37621 RepID=A0ABM1EQ11_PRICU|nr:PREDICTED: EKC/KEOPS complex subunit LAGE3-like [Priapulus caudatus]